MTGISTPLHNVGFNPLNAELNRICHLLALLGGATIVVVSRLRVKTLRRFGKTLVSKQLLQMSSILLLLLLLLTVVRFHMVSLRDLFLELYAF